MLLYEARKREEVFLLYLPSSLLLHLFHPSFPSLTPALHFDLFPQPPIFYSYFTCSPFSIISFLPFLFPLYLLFSSFAYYSIFPFPVPLLLLLPSPIPPTSLLPTSSSSPFPHILIFPFSPPLLLLRVVAKWNSHHQRLQFSQNNVRSHDVLESPHHHHPHLPSPWGKQCLCRLEY